METYRLYPLDKKGKIASFPNEFHAENDERAVSIAAEKLYGHHGELWRGSRRVARLSTSREDSSHPLGQAVGLEAQTA